MSTQHADILELIAELPVAERRELINHVYDAGLVDDGFYERLSPAQKAELVAGLADAEARAVISASELKDEISRRFGFAHL